MQDVFEQLRNTSLLEFVAVIAGIVSVWFSRKENIWVYPIGLINTIIFIYISLKAQLIGEASVNFYYTVMSVYGWWIWSKKDNAQNPLVHISFSNKKEWIQEIIFFSLLLCDVVLYSHFPKTKTFSYSYSVGRCISIGNRLYRYVANGKKKSGKLVVVDCNKHCIYTLVL